MGQRGSALEGVAVTGAGAKPLGAAAASTEWVGRRVFLTGHTGFKGSWLSLWLQRLGAVVRGYSLAAPTTPNLFEAAGVAEGMDSMTGDVLNAERLRVEMTAFRPEVVFHLAAQSLVRYSYANPLQTYAVNVMGTANVLDAVRGCGGVKAVVVITTDKCYENREWLWPYRENDQLGGYDPYSNSKACAELVTGAFRTSYFAPEQYAEHGVAVATARAGNVIGGGDWAPDRLIPDIVRSFAEGVAVRIRSPKSVRPWQHVLEPVRGYLMLAAALCKGGTRFGSAWNFGPRTGDEMPVIEIVQRMAGLWNGLGGNAAWEVDAGPHFHETAQLRVDWSKAATELGWRPALGIDEALAMTADWYACCRDTRGGSMRDFTLQQIAGYAERAVA